VDTTYSAEKDKWVGATRVKRDIEEYPKILYEKIEPEFPRNENNEIEW
jgi:hypothetical protein